MPPSVSCSLTEDLREDELIVGPKPSHRFQQNFKGLNPGCEDLYCRMWTEPNICSQANRDVYPLESTDF